MSFPAYCSFDYLLQLFQFKSLPEVGTENQAIANLQLRDLVLNGVEIITDVTKEKIDEHQDNPYVLHLIKKNRITPKPSVFSQLRSGEKAYFQEQCDCNGLYCLSATYSKERLSALQQQSGYYFLGSGSNASDLFQDKVHDLVARSKSTWTFLHQMMQPHRSIVIADPYLFKQAGIDACNLLLNEILPKRLYAPYHITLVGSSDRRSLKPDIPLATIKRSAAVIQEKVAKYLPQAIVEFHVVNKEEFHDRLIITNNVMIYSGSGLDAISKNGEASKDSYWVSISPFKRLQHNELVGSFGYKAIRGKLQRLKKWIEQSEQKVTTNPLLH